MWLQIMRYFKHFAFLFEKETYKPMQRLLARLYAIHYNRLKNLSAAMNATRTTLTKSKFFLYKNCLI